MNEASHVKQIKQRANCQCSLSKLHIMTRRSDSQMQMEATALPSHDNADAASRGAGAR